MKTVFIRFSVFGAREIEEETSAGKMFLISGSYTPKENV